MRASRKAVLIVMIIILAGQLLGEIKAAAEIKAPGKLLIPTEQGFKSFNAVVTITRVEIGIECALNIFQPFNQFDAPRQEKIKFKAVEVDRIWLYGNEIIILPRNPLYRRYRNLFHHIRLFCIICSRDKKAIIFELDDPAEIGTAGEELIQTIDDRQKKTSHGFTGGFKGYIFQ